MKKLKYEILSPDMIPIEINGGYKTKKRRKKLLANGKNDMNSKGTTPLIMAE